MSHTPDRRLSVAQTMLERERYADAARIARDVLAGEPEDAEAHRMLAMAQVGLGNFDDALAEMQAALTGEPDSAFNVYSLAYVYARRGELTLAERAAHAALAIDPEAAPAVRLLAHINLAQGRPQSSLADADQALALDPNGAKSYVARADALLELRRPDEALAMLREALALEPNDAGVYASLGLAEASLDRHRAAEAAFREALRIDPRMEVARGGLLLAMKLRNPVYRALRGRFRFAYIIAGALAIGVCAQFPATYPLAVTLALIALPVFLFIDHVTTLQVRFDAAGRRALSQLETLNSNIFVAALMPPLVATALWGIDRFDSLAFAAGSLGFAFLFALVAIDRKPGKLRSFILANAVLWAVVSIVIAVTLASTGVRNWEVASDRIEKSGGVRSLVENIAFVVLALQLFIFGFFMIGYCYFDLVKDTAKRSVNRAIDVRRSWKKLMRR